MNKNISILGLILHIMIFFILYLIPFNLLSGISLTYVLAVLLIIYLTSFYLLYRFMFDAIPIYIFGIGMFIVGFLGNIIAIIFSPEYIMWKWSISVLGHEPGGMFMRTGLIISYNLAIPFFIKFDEALKDEIVNDILRKLAVACGLFTSVTAMLTGTFSGSFHDFISLLHGLFALMSWLGGVAVTFLFGFLMLKNSKFTKKIKNLSFIITGILVFYLIPFFIVNFCNLFPKTSSIYAVGRSIYLIMPTFEWIVIFSILLWFLFNSIYLYRSSERKSLNKVKERKLVKGDSLYRRN